MLDTYGENACGVCGCPASSDVRVGSHECRSGRHYGTVGLGGSVTWHDRQDTQRTGGLFRSLLPLLVLLLIALPAAAQRWEPPQGSQVALISIAGHTVARFTIDLDTPDPWSGLRWPSCGAPDPQTYADRYFEGNALWFGAGFNCTGFANENAFLGGAAVSKVVCGTTVCYVPLCQEVTDWNCTHQRSCAAYGLTAAEGCGSGGPPPDPPPFMPADVAKYCHDHQASCRPYRGCLTSICPCYSKQASSSAPGGYWVYYDPTRASCTPDGAQAPPPPPPAPPPRHPGPGGRSLLCQQAINDLIVATALVDASCEAPRQ